jgi:hypothetical protein
MRILKLCFLTVELFLVAWLVVALIVQVFHVL